MKMTIAAKKQWVIEQLDTNPRAVELAVLAIYNRQTTDEQATDSTNNLNSMGFNGTDAQFGSSLAKSILTYGKLSPKQAGYARKLIGKYWKQLIEVAETKRRTTGRGGAPWVVVTKCEGCGEPAGFEADNGAPACSTCLDLSGRILTATELPLVDAEDADGYGCQWCGCPEYHDGEECPSAAARCPCGNQRTHGENMCYTCVNAERAVSRAETMGY